MFELTISIGLALIALQTIGNYQSLKHLTAISNDNVANYNQKLIELEARIAELEK